MQGSYNNVSSAIYINFQSSDPAYDNQPTNGDYYVQLFIYGSGAYVSENWPDWSNSTHTFVASSLTFNSAPTISGAPSDITVTEDIASNLDLSAITTADSDGDSLTMTLTVSEGTLTASSGGSVTVGGSGSSTMTLSGTAANINTFLDTASNIQYTSASDDSGDNAATLSVKVNDGTVDSSTSTVNLDITNVNDAPSFSSGATLSAVNEDVSSPSGATVSTLLNGNFSDSADSDSFAGIAVSADASNDSTEGDWEYSTDGSTWYDIGSVTTASALLLDTNATLRFVPVADYNGTPGSLTVFAVDNSSATTFTSGATRQTFDTMADDATSKVSTSGVSVGTSVTAINDEPTLSATGANPTYTEDGSGSTLFTGSTVSTVESGQSIASMKVTVTNVTDSTEYLIVDGTDVALTDGISGTSSSNSFGYSVSVSGSTATVTITKTDTAANYDTLIEGLKYKNSADDPTTGSSRVVTITELVDSGSSSGDNDNTAVLSVASTVTVAGLNDEPTLTATGANPTYTEEGSGSTLFTGATLSTIEAGQTLESMKVTVTNVTDSTEYLIVDGTDVALTDGISGTSSSNSFGYSVSVSGTTATVTITKSASTSVYDTMLEALQYKNSAEDPSTGSTRVITITELVDSGSNSGSNDSTAALSVASTVTVAPASDAPVVTAGATLSYTENGSAAAIDETITISDVDDTQIAGATVTISVGLTSGDTLGFTTQNGISGSYNSSSGVLTLSGTATVAQYQTALRTVTYSSSSEDPIASSSSRTISWVVTDADSDGAGVASSTAVTSTVSITATNDAPTSSDKTVSVNEDSSYTFTVSDFNFSDVDSADSLYMIEITSVPFVGRLTLNGATVSATNLIFASDITAGKLKFTPALNASGSSYASFGFKVQDGTEWASSGSTMTVDVTAQNDAPTSNANSITLNEEATHTFTSSDFPFSDVDSGAAIASVKIIALPGSGGTLSHSDSGAVSVNDVITIADINAGKLTYTDAAGYVNGGTDFMQFQVGDGTTFSDTETMTINITPSGGSETIDLSGSSINWDPVLVATEFDYDDDTQANKDGLDLVGDNDHPMLYTKYDSKGGGSESDDEIGFRIRIGEGKDNVAYFIAVDANADGAIDLLLSADKRNGGKGISIWEPGSGANNSPATTSFTEPSSQITYDISSSNYSFDAVNGTTDPAATDTDMDDGRSGTDYFVSFKLPFADFQSEMQRIAGISITKDSSMQYALITSTQDNAINGDIGGTSGNSSSTMTYAELGVWSGTLTPSTPPSEFNPYNHAPVVADAIADITLSDGGDWSFRFDSDVFYDTDGDTLSYSAKRTDGYPLPDWLSFDSSTRTFSGNPPESFKGQTLSIDLTADDGNGGTVTDTFTVTLPAETNNAPVLDNPLSDQTYAGSGEWSYTVPANTFSDPDGDPLTWSATQADGTALPSWLSFNALTRTFSGNPPGDTNDIFLKVTVSDGNSGSAFSTFHLEIDADTTNDTPVISNAIADQTFSGEGNWIYQVPTNAITDPDGENLTWSATQGDDSALPGWLTFNTSTRTFSGNPPHDASWLDLKVTGTDGSSETVSDTFRITFTSVNDTPTLENPISAQSFSGTGDWTFQFNSNVFSDVETNSGSYSSPDVISYTAALADGSSLPSWLSFTSATRTFSGNPSNGVGRLDIRVTADDGNGATVSDTFAAVFSGTNDAPSSSDNTVSATEDTNFVFSTSDFPITDLDNDEVNSVEITALESVGTLQFYNGSSWVDVTANQEISAYDIAANYLRFVPVADANGNSYDSFSYKVTDSQGISTSAYTMTINVTAVNDTPTLNAVTTITVTDTSSDDTYSDTAATLVSNDIDNDNSTLVYSITGQSSESNTISGTTYNRKLVGGYGTLYLGSSSGDYRYVVNDTAVEALKSDTSEYFTFNVSDGYLSASRTLTVSLVAANDTPQISATLTSNTYTDTAADDSWSSVAGILGSSDRDFGETATYSIVGQSSDSSQDGFTHSLAGSYGTLYLNSSSGAYRYDPTDSAIEALTSDATDSFTLRVTDGSSASDDQALTISLTAANDTPTLSASLTQSTFVDTADDDTFSSVSGSLTTVDRDSGASQTYSISGQSSDTSLSGYTHSKTGTYGTLYLNSSSGAYIYQPNDSALDGQSAGSNSESFTLSVSDGSLSDSKTLTIYAVGASDQPVITEGSDTETIAETDAALSTSGTMRVTDLDFADEVQLTRTVAASGNPSITISDSDLLAMMTVTPTTVLDNSSDITAQFNWSFNSGATTFDGLDAGRQLILTYTITATDTGTPTLTATDTVTITINGTDDGPTLGAVTSISYTDQAGDDSFAETSGTLDGGDLDVNATLTYSVLGQSSDTSRNGFTHSRSGTYGSLFLNSSNGNYLYVPDNTAIQALTSDSSEVFSVRVSDGTGTADRTLTISLTAANDTPELTASVESVTYTDTSATDSFVTTNGVLSTTDRDSGATQSYSVSGGSSDTSVNGYTHSKSGTYGTLYINSDSGAYSYIPNDSAINGLSAGSNNETFTLSVSDGSASDSVTLTVYAVGISDTPIITDAADTAGLTETDSGLTTSGSLTVSDLDTSDTVNLTTSLAVSGTGTTSTSSSDLLNMLSLSSSSILSNGSDVEASVDWTFDSGAVAFDELAAGETVILTYTITAADTGSPSLSDTDTITITITGTNDDPVISNGADTASISETDSAISASGNFTVVDKDVTDVVSVQTSLVVSGSSSLLDSSKPSDSTLLGMLSLDSTPVLNGSNDTVTLGWTFDSGNETFNYIATGETLILTYTIVVSDDDSSTSSDRTTVTVTITGTNDRPTAVVDTGTAVESGGTSNGSGGSDATGNVLTNDIELDTANEDTWSVTAFSFSGTSGSVGSELSGNYGSLTLNSDGSYTYAINESHSDVEVLRTAADTLTEVFNYTVQDAGGLNHSNTLTLTIEGINDRPTLTGSTVADDLKVMGASYSADASVLFADIDRNGESFTYSAANLPPGITIDSSTGVLSGGGTLPGKYDVVVTATDLGGLSIDAASFEIQVIDASKPGGNEGGDGGSGINGGSDGGDGDGGGTGTGIDGDAGGGDGPGVPGTGEKGFNSEIPLPDPASDGSNDGGLGGGLPGDGGTGTGFGGGTGFDGGTGTGGFGGSAGFEGNTDTGSGSGTDTRSGSGTGTGSGSSTGTGTGGGTSTSGGINGGTSGGDGGSTGASGGDTGGGESSTGGANSGTLVGRDGGTAGSENSAGGDGTAGGDKGTADAANANQDLGGESATATETESPGSGNDGGGEGNSADSNSSDPASVSGRGDKPGSTQNEVAIDRIDVKVGSNGQVEMSQRDDSTGGGIKSDMMIVDITQQGEVLSIEIADFQSADVTQYSAVLPDGSPLPDWISIDPQTGAVSGTPPEGIEQVDLQIVALEQDGSVRMLDVRIDLTGEEGDVITLENKFTTFSEQLEQASAERDDNLLLQLVRKAA